MDTNQNNLQKNDQKKKKNKALFLWFHAHKAASIALAAAVVAGATVGGLAIGGVFDAEKTSGEDKPREEINSNYLYFLANDTNSVTIGYNAVSLVQGTNIDIEISNDARKWEKWDSGSSTTSTGGNVNTVIDKDNNPVLYVKNNMTTLSSSSSNYFQFTTTGTGTVSIGGKINSMLNGGGLNSNCYYKLFKDCAKINNITDDIQLSDALATNCFCHMFSGIAISSLPANFSLSATSIPTVSYDHMFDSCSNLSSLPLSLFPETITYPAGTVGHMGYMFSGCTSLEITTVEGTNTHKLITPVGSTTGYMARFVNMFNLCKGVPETVTAGAWLDGSGTPDNVPIYWVEQ